MRREDRFIGHGNFACGDGHNRVKAWKINCSICSSMKMLTMPTGILPPDAVVKRLIQAGWEIGKKAEEDRCPGCVARRADQKERDDRIKINAPVPVNSDSETVQRERSFIVSIHSLLIDGRTKEAISRIEAHIPATKQKEKSLPAPIKNIDIVQNNHSNFDDWLAEQEKIHKGKNERPR